MDKFSERIRELRAKKDLSQEELGNIAGVGKQAVSSWERNESKPRSDVLNVLADFFNVTTDYLLGRTDNPRSDVIPAPSVSPDDLELLEKLKNLSPEKRKAIEILAGADEQSAAMGK